VRLLWVQRQPALDDGGDSVYDRKLQQALAAQHDITPYPLGRNGRLKQLVSAAVRLSPPEQWGFGGDGDVEKVRNLLRQGFDAIVFSHEHLDAFAARLRPHTEIPFVSVRHNVSSDAMASILGADTPAGGLYRALSERQERRALRGPLFQTVTAISTRDRELLRKIGQRDDVGLVLPGAPPPAPLHPSATCARDLVISGTFDWFPKARDLKAFARDFAAAPIPDAQVYVSPGVPNDIRAALAAHIDSSLEQGKHIRFGLITDRFTAGHKLKTAAYIMNNCAVLSYAQVLHDFEHLPNAARWIRQIGSIGDIAAVMQAFAERPAAELRAELAELKAAIGTQFAWSTQAEALSRVIGRAQRKPVHEALR
jgi:hypothetical protein